MLREAGVERLREDRQHFHDGPKITAVGDELGALFFEQRNIFGGARRPAPSDAVFRGGGGHRGLGGEHFRILPIQRATEAQGEIARADEKPVDAARASDGVDICEGLRRFDLHDEERLGVGGGGIGEGAVEVEIVVEPGAVETALTEMFPRCFVYNRSDLVFR